MVLRTQLLAEMWAGEQDYCTRPSASGVEAAPPGAPLLRGFVDTFVQEEFLPEVYVDFRCRETGCAHCFGGRCHVDSKQELPLPHSALSVPWQKLDLPLCCILERALSLSPTLDSQTHPSVQEQVLQDAEGRTCVLRGTERLQHPAAMEVPYNV